MMVEKLSRTREKRRVDYAALLKPAKLPRARANPKARTQHELFDLKVLERDSGSSRVKVHYMGYGSSDDEWRAEADI